MASGITVRVCCCVPCPCGCVLQPLPSSASARVSHRAAPPPAARPPPPQPPPRRRHAGLWQAGEFGGLGTYYYRNGDIYSGSWQGGERHGEGTLLFAGDGSQLVGAWERGALVVGRWLLADGTSWHGGFVEGKPRGPGVFYLPNGLMQQGEYVRERVGGACDEDDPALELRTVWRGAEPTPANIDYREAAQVAP